MEHFKPCALTEAGTLVTIEGEIAIASIDKVSLQTHDKRATSYRSGLVTVTSHRLVWTDPSRRSAISAYLSEIPPSGSVTDKSSALRSRVLVHFGAGVRLEFDNRSSKERGRFLEALRGAMARAEWVRQAELRERERAQQEQLQRGDYVRKRIGVAGVADQVQKRTGETGRAINSGLSGLNQLRDQAEDLVGIAKKFRNIERGGVEDNELLNMMADMGIESPVTKDGAGGNIRTYREQLARQIVLFLRKPVLNVGGIMTLSDAYCLVIRNRASTELVSPADFRGACDLFESIGLPIRLVQLESGVLAVQLDERDESGASALLELAKERGSISALDVVEVRHIPIQRALAMLAQAEQLELVVRDVSDDGTRFFPNEFKVYCEA